MTPDEFVRSTQRAALEAPDTLERGPASQLVSRRVSRARDSDGPKQRAGEGR
jgi:hypothetical protein